jgi:hypothetical protein
MQGASSHSQGSGAMESIIKQTYKIGRYFFEKKRKATLF